MVDDGGCAWVNGRVLTGSRETEALLVESGRVVAAGGDAEVRRTKGTGTPVVDLGGRLVIPGLIDAHLHVGRLLMMRHGLDASGVQSVDQLLAQVAEAVERTAPRTPVLGGGWDEERFAPARYPTREELDRVAADHPVVLYRHCEHLAVANSAALDRLGLDDHSPDPPRGRLGRTGGRLNGLLHEGALRGLAPLEEEALRGLAPKLPGLLEEAARYGLTTVAPMRVGRAELELLEGTVRPGASPLRFRAYARAESLPEVASWPRGAGEGDLRIVGVKIVADGSLGARTAWLEEPYEDAPGGNGVSLTSDSDLVGAIGAAAALELPVAVHAIGDRALHQVLTILRAEPGVGAPRIEHASLTPPPRVAELLRVRPHVVVQPRFIATDTMVPARLGVERARWTYAFRTLSDHGLVLAGSSDAPVESLDPWTGMAAAIAPRLGASRGEELLPSEALALYTVNGATALGEPGLGTLAPGSPGDLVVLDTGSWEAALGLGSASVRATYRAGRPTFERAGAPGAVRSAGGAI